MSSMPAAAAAPPDATVIVDFDVAVDPPLVKKFDFMNSGIVPMWRYRRDLELIEDLRVQTLRIDLFWGEPQINGWINEMVSGTPDELQFDFTEFDELSQLLKQRGVAGYWSYCYNPAATAIRQRPRHPSLRSKRLARDHVSVRPPFSRGGLASDLPCHLERARPRYFL